MIRSCKSWAHPDRLVKTLHSHGILESLLLITGLLNHVLEEFESKPGIFMITAWHLWMTEWVNNPWIISLEIKWNQSRSADTLVRKIGVSWAHSSLKNNLDWKLNPHEVFGIFGGGGTWKHVENTWESSAETCDTCSGCRKLKFSR